jgi:hypothetical protein
MKHLANKCIHMKMHQNKVAYFLKVTPSHVDSSNNGSFLINTYPKHILYSRYIAHEPIKNIFKKSSREQDSE